MTEAILNRVQRRAIERFQRRAQYVKRHPAPRPKQIPMLARMTCVLAPLESILDEIERTGTVNTGPAGMPIFQPLNEENWYPMVPAIIGVAELFEMFATRHNRTLDMAGLTQFAHRLEYGMPITQTEIDAARSVMGRLRRVVVGLTQDEADDLLRQVQIKAELEALTKGKSA